MATEIWRQVAEFPAYDVSNAGRVRRGLRIKTPVADRKGYLSVSLWANQIVTKRTIARLVAAAFIGPRPTGYVVRHRDGIKAHNHASNLEYGTRIENEADKRRHGTVPLGEAHPAAILTAEKVQFIRQAYRHGLGRSLASQFGVQPETVYKIVHRKIWREVE